VGNFVGRGVCSGVGLRVGRREVGAALDGSFVGLAVAVAVGFRVGSDVVGPYVVVGRAVGSATRLQMTNNAALESECKFDSLVAAAIRSIASALRSASESHFRCSLVVHPCRRRHVPMRSSFASAYALPQCGVHTRTTVTREGAVCAPTIVPAMADAIASASSAFAANARACRPVISRRPWIVMMFSSVGLADGEAEGERLGDADGLKLGLAEGDRLGDIEGDRLGDDEGLLDGLRDGLQLGLFEGLPLGDDDGDALGLSEGLHEGDCDGDSDGLELGD
jgi:hypothetical protein